MKEYISIALGILLLVMPAVTAGSVISGINIETDGTSAIEQYLETSDGVVNVVQIDNEGQMTYQWQVFYEDGTSELVEYIEDNEGSWSHDEGESRSQITTMFEDAVDWVLGREDVHADNYEQRIGIALDDYQQNNPYTQELLAMIIDLQYRVEALENTQEATNAEAYCQGKMEVMAAYGLTGVRCEDTFYRNHLNSPITGEPMIIGLSPANEQVVAPEDTTSLESKVIVEDLEEPDTIYFGKPFSLKATIKNQGDDPAEDYITIAIPEGWELDAPAYYTVSLEGGQSQELHFGVTPTTIQGEIAVGSSSDFKSTGALNVQSLPITSRMTQAMTNFAMSIDALMAGLIAACLVIPSLVWFKKGSIVGVLRLIQIRKVPTEFHYRYKMN